jgi:hypothetical protein
MSGSISLGNDRDESIADREIPAYAGSPAEPRTICVTYVKSRLFIRFRVIQALRADLKQNCV